MANKKISELTTLGTIDRTTDYLEVVDSSAGASTKATPNQILGITGNPVGHSDSQTLTNKTITSPTISSPTLSGTLVGTYTIGGTPTFPSSVVTLTGAQTLTNKILTSPTINTATIANPTLTVDTVSEYTAANGVTIDGLNIKDSALNTNNSVVTANITNGAVTSPKVTFSGAQAYRNSAQSLSNSTITAIQFNNENYDTDTYHSNATNNTRFTVPSAGYYLCKAAAEFAPNATGQRYLWISRGGTTAERFGEMIQPSNSAGGSTVMIAVDVIYVTAGSYVEAYAFQNSGGALNIYVSDTYATSFTIARLGS
jgi:hypothetical protein